MRVRWDDERIERLLERLEEIDGVAFWAIAGSGQVHHSHHSPTRQARQQLLSITEETVSEIEKAYRQSPDG